MDQFALDFRHVLCCENGIWGNSLLLAGEAEMPEARGAPAAPAGEEGAREPGALSCAAQGCAAHPPHALGGAGRGLVALASRRAMERFGTR